MKRIALIHATPVALEPIAEAFRAEWPEARTTNLLDDSLSQDVAADGRLTPSMHRRFCDLAVYSERARADAILFTCSAFGPCIDTARRVVGIPVLKPNEAMIDAAFAMGRRFALVATFEPSIPSMKTEIEEEAKKRDVDVVLSTVAVPDALAALRAGDAEKHDALIAEAVRKAVAADAVILAQFSMARAESAVARVAKGRVLTSPRLAVRELRRLLVG